MVHRYLMSLYPSIVLLIFTLALLHPGSEAIAQQQVTLTPTKDNTLYESATGALSNGAGSYFFAGRTGQISGSIRRGLIAFDVAGSVPSGATILSVTLTLNMSKTPSGAQSVSLHRVLADWGEGTSVAGQGEGGGAPSTTGDATWIHRFYNTTLWTTAGGEFDATASATQTVSGLGGYTWGSTPAMVSDVQGWLNNPSTNYGWLVRGNESATRTAKRFDSRENPNPGARPQLTITYQGGVGVNEDEGIPEAFTLFQNYPNPFNPATSFKFQVPGLEFVSLKIYDMLGREVATLVNEVKAPGTYTVTWDAGNIGSGVYYGRMKAGTFSDVKRMILMK